VQSIYWLENLKERDHSKDLRIDGRTILEWILGKWGFVGVNWIPLAHGKGPASGFSEHGVERSGSIKCDEFLG